MSHVVGIDFDSHAIHLVRLDETTADCDYTRIVLDGGAAWDRTRQVQRRMPAASWWDDVYLAAIEAPMGHRSHVLYRVQGAALASIPGPLELWEVRLHEWKGHLGLAAGQKPSAADLGYSSELVQPDGQPWPQDARDALAIARYARDTNQKALERRIA